MTKKISELLSFDLSEYKMRLEGVRNNMREGDIDVALITAQEDCTYLTGHPYGPPPRGICVILPRNGKITMIERLIEGGNIEQILGKTIDEVFYWRDDAQMYAPYPGLYNKIAEVLVEGGMENKNIGVQLGNNLFTAKSFEILREALPNAIFKDATDVVELCRLIKTPAEIACVRSAGRIATKGCAAGIAAVKEGVSENEVTASIMNAMLECMDYEFTPMVPHIASGPRAAMAHCTWSGRILKEGDTVYLEVPASVNRYTAITLRTVSVGRPSEKTEKVSMVIKEALDAAIEAIKPGIKAGEIDYACRSVIDKAGYGEYFRHRTGYTIGLEWSQKHGVNLTPNNQSRLRAGMTFHVIPICMFFGEGAVGMSESVLVTEEGAEVLTDLDRKLFIKS